MCNRDPYCRLVVQSRRQRRGCRRPLDHPNRLQIPFCLLRHCHHSHHLVNAELFPEAEITLGDHLSLPVVDD